MTDRPIIFSAPMVKALLREVQQPGKGKTQTRRLASSPLAKAKPGDRLWVRESHQFRGADCGDSFGEIEWFRCYSSFGAGDNWDPDFPDGWEPTIADRPRLLTSEDEQEGDDIKGYVTKLRPSIHMPRWASRLTLVVTEVRREHLQDISEEDAIAEGARLAFGDWFDAGFAEVPADTVPRRTLFAGLWEKLHGVGAWDQNPELVALTFTVHDCNVDRLAEVTA